MALLRRFASASRAPSPAAFGFGDLGPTGGFLRSEVFLRIMDPSTCFIIQYLLRYCKFIGIPEERIMISSLIPLRILAYLLFLMWVVPAVLLLSIPQSSSWFKIEWRLPAATFSAGLLMAFLLVLLAYMIMRRIEDATTRRFAQGVTGDDDE